jgi:hypothetical protein
MAEASREDDAGADELEMAEDSLASFIVRQGSLRDEWERAACIIDVSFLN